MYVDLGAKADLDHVYLKWEAAYAKSYQIQFLTMKRIGQQFTQRVTVQVQKKLLKKQLSLELWL